MYMYPNVSVAVGAHPPAPKIKSFFFFCRLQTEFFQKTPTELCDNFSHLPLMFMRLIVCFRSHSRIQSSLVVKGEH